MKKLLARRPSPAIIIAVIALFAAVGGTAVAGPGKFLSIGKFQKFKKNTNAFKTTALKGPIAYSTVTVSIPPTPPTSPGTTISAPCPAGTAPTGGGIQVSNDLDEFVNDSHPSTVGWSGTVVNAGTSAHTAAVTAICAAGLTSGPRPNPSP